MTRIWFSLAVILGLAVGTTRAEKPGQSERRVSPQSSMALAVEKPEPRRVPASPVRASSPRSAADAPSLPLAQNPPEPVSVVPGQDGEHRHTRLVVRLKAVPAAQVASTIVGLLQAEAQGQRGAAVRNVVIVPDVVGNSLVIGGPPDAVDEVRKLAEQLDHPAVMVRVEFVLVEVPAGDQRAATGPKPDAKAPEALCPDAMPKGSEILVRAELTTLDNQPAHLQVGRRTPRITGGSISQMGMVNSVTLENLGTNIGVTPRVGADRTVVMEVELEDSRFGPREEGVAVSLPARGEPLRTPNIETLTTQTTVKIADGKTVIIGGMARDSKPGKQRMVLVTPHILTMSGQALGGRTTSK